MIHEYHVINGRLSLRSECMLARFQKAGGTIQYIDRGPACVTVSATHPKGGSPTVSWTMTRAREAGLTANPTWQKHPTAMLAARATAEAVRAVYPACISGIIAEEEAEEIAGIEAHIISGNGNGSGNGHNLPRGRSSKRSDPSPVAERVAQSVPSHDRPALSIEAEVAPRTSDDMAQSPRQTRAADVQRPAAGVRTGPAEPAPEPQPEALEPTFVAEPENHKPGSSVAAFWHPLDDTLGGLNQEKLTAFLVNHGLIDPGQNYKHCGPKATSRIQKQLPSFLKAAGFEEELAH